MAQPGVTPEPAVPKVPDVPAAVPMVENLAILSDLLRAHEDATPEARRAAYETVRANFLSSLNARHDALSADERETVLKALDNAFACIEMRAQAKSADAPAAPNMAPVDAPRETARIYDFEACAARQSVGVAAQYPTPMARRAALTHILTGFGDAVPAVDASAVMLANGDIVAGSLPPDVEQAQVASLIAMLSRVGGETSRELKCGEAREMIVRGDLGYVLAVTAGPEHILFAIASAAAPLGALLLEAHEAARAIAAAAAAQFHEALPLPA